MHFALCEPKHFWLYWLLMKKVLTYLLIFSMTGASFHIDELTKLPYLLTHYTEHCRLHPNDSFMNFLAKHYILNQSADSEKDKHSDEQLPYKSWQNIIPHIAPFIFAEVINMPIPVGMCSTVIFPPLIPVYQSVSFRHWQPPWAAASVIFKIIFCYT